MTKNLSYSSNENTMDIAFYMTDSYFDDNDAILLNYKNDSLNECNY